ncbi:MAG: hypothetical protein QW484_02900 [Candidatus Pacearchaeota archaeon]
MNILTIILVIIIALLGYPTGLLIAKFTEEELHTGRKWFKLIIVVCILAIIVSIFIAKAETLLFLISSFIFILLVALASLIKLRKKK